MRRGGKLALCCLAAAALTVCWPLLRTDSRPGAAAPLPTPSAAYEMMYERDVTRFETLAVTLPEGGYTVRSSMAFDENGGLLGVYNNLGQPVVVEGQEDFILDRTAYQMMLLCAQHLPATARYDALDLNACGLYAPDARITVTYAGDEPLVLTVGHVAASRAGCYVQMSGDEGVYLVPVDFHDVMTRPLSGQHRLPGALGKSADDAVQAAVVTADETVIVTRTTGEAEGGVLFPWRVDQPFVHPGSTAQAEALVSGISALRAEAYVASAQTQEDLAEYGLDRPTRLIASFSDGTIRDIRLGADAGEGRLYALMDGTGDVYLISSAQLAFVQSATLDNLLDRFVALVPASGVASVRIRTPDGEVLLTQSWAGEEDTSPQNQAVNDRDVPRDVFTSLYSGLIGLTFDKTAPADAPGGSTLAEILFTLRDGSEITVRYDAYDRRYALAQVDGDGRFLVRRTQLEEALEEIRKESETP